MFVETFQKDIVGIGSWGSVSLLLRNRKDFEEL